MRSQIFLKLMAVFFLVIATATITLDISVRRAWERTLREQIERSLVQKTRMLANRIETDRTKSVQDIASQEAQAASARVTVIDPTGKVLADSEADPSSMENHAQRKEFIAALAGNIGMEERQSHTLGIPFEYVAAPMTGGAVRLAYPLSEVRNNQPASATFSAVGLGAGICPGADSFDLSGKLHGPTPAANPGVCGKRVCRGFERTHRVEFDG